MLRASTSKFGTGELDRTLINHKLVDEYHFWVFPVIAGGGQRLLDDIETTHLKLVDIVQCRWWRGGARSRALLPVIDLVDR